MKDRTFGKVKIHESNRAIKKKPYIPPVFHVYGSLHLQTHGSTGNAHDASSQKQPKGSDRRLKENIVRIGSHSLGIGLYLFDFKPQFRYLSNHFRQFGVMADEVERVLPEAVSKGQDGYKMVDYQMLGIRLTDS